MAEKNPPVLVNVFSDAFAKRAQKKKRKNIPRVYRANEFSKKRQKEMHWKNRENEK